MAISAWQWVLDHSESAHASRLVLLAIADDIREDRISDGAWPSVQRLMTRTRLKERAVQMAIADLEKLGELRVARNAGPKGCNLYHIVFPRTPAKYAPPQNMHPAEDAPPQSLRGDEFPQADGQKGANNAPPAENAGAQNLRDRGAKSAPEPDIEPEVKTSSRPRRDLNEGRDDVERLCAHLADRIQANDPDNVRPAYGQRWRDSVRLMLDADRRSEEKIRAAIDWCQDDEFWRGVVRSMPKLRLHYAVLQQRAKEQLRKQAASNGHGPRTAAPVKPGQPEHMARR